MLIWIGAWACKASGTEDMPAESTEPVSVMDTKADASKSAEGTEAAERETLPENKTWSEGKETEWSTDGTEQTETEADSMVMMIIEMSMYGGFEQVGAIGQKLPATDSQITTQAGDVVLYAGDKLVVFYGSNSWAYTKLGKIDKIAREMKDLLGDHDVTIEILVGTP